LLLTTIKTLSDDLKSLGTDLSQFAAQLDDPSKTMLALFPEAPLKKHLHVIVDIRPAGEFK
jgi:hypothetical protein